MAVATYYFDASDAAATDPGGVWTNDANAFDSDVATSASCSTNGSVSSNFLLAEGTSAPSINGIITQVRMRIYKNSGIADIIGNATAYTDSLAESLGNATVDCASSGVPAYGSFTTLSAPSGGWTFAKLQALEVKLFATSSFSGAFEAGRVDLEVTYDVDQGSANTAWLRA